MASEKLAHTTTTPHAGLTQLNVSDPDLPYKYQQDGITVLQPKRLWIRLMTFLHWYPSDMPYEEKSLILKLDLSILIFGCLSFFTKYLDQQSITIAYVR